ncbi:MAG TPA: Gfo/Idh/MocA family oxidoreductase [Sphingobacteriaceae bacterium]|nr:Gfo/Idh/MocA family oxidoreductase [Sphingobacteriaceae bacterium]
MKVKKESRREFISKIATATAAVSFGGILPGFSAKSYASIIGSNERVQVAMMGVNSRGLALAQTFSKSPKCDIRYVCDVDKRATEKCIALVSKNMKKAPKAQPDFRKALEDKNLDAIAIAAPDHWHAPAAILASKAGKHVYLEKPCSHNPNEGELLVAAAAKYKNIIQMGNQRRSSPSVIAGIKELHSGVIGRPYFAKAWYSANRASIGVGKRAAVPEWLDYDLWQGPAPRREFKDNLIHYNWHWFWNWGTGEALNNGTHMIDIARWGLQLDYPTQVSSTGGRYRFQDDWETPDTQVINLKFKDSMISWEGRSCNPKFIENAGVGVIFYGENGAMSFNGSNTYTIFDLQNKVIKEVNDTTKIDASNTVNPSMGLDGLHISNFLDAIQNGAKLNSEIVGGHQSTLLVQLGNIALRSGETLNIDPSNGRILNNKNAMQYWSREYQPGWEPVI